MLDGNEASAPKRLRLVLAAWQTLARKVDPGRSRITTPVRLAYWLNGAANSTLSHIQQRSFADAIRAVVIHPPIFVLGFWRSGTTLLHELLCCDPRLGFPTTYACLNPSHFLLSESWNRRKMQPQTRRPMDELRYSWSSPQEDEFALFALGAPSPYAALLVPSLMRDAASLLAVQDCPAADQDKWSAALNYFLKLLTVRESKPMVLKSPAHGYRMPALQRQFPEARYLIIERNPYEVFASNLKLWQTLTSRYSLEHCPSGLIEEFILDAYALHEAAIAEGIRRLPAQFLTRVRYEKLERNPMDEMRRMYTELELGDFAAARPLLEKHLKAVSGHVRNRFQLSVAQKMRVDRAWGSFIRQKSYTWPEDYISLQ